MAELVFCCTAGRWVLSSLRRLIVLVVGRLLEHHCLTLGVILLEGSRNANLVSSVCNASLLLRVLHSHLLHELGRRLLLVVLLLTLLQDILRAISSKPLLFISHKVAVLSRIHVLVINLLFQTQGTLILLLLCHQLLRPIYRVRCGRRAHGQRR
jgi:uncharacterized membrane protein YhhN